MKRPVVLLATLASLLIIVSPGVSGGTEAYSGFSATQAEVTVIPGTVPLPEGVERGLGLALSMASGDLPAADAYSVSDVRRAGDWLFVSVVGLHTVGDHIAGWSLDDAVWAGLVLLWEQGDGAYGAVAGTRAFSRLLGEVPEAILDAETKLQLDPLQRRPAAAAEIRFPWQIGTRMYYGGLGVHNAGFIDGWKAVDFLSDGDTGAGHAPNRLLAAASGAISYVCNDGTSVAIRIGDLFYVHLLDNPNLEVGHSFARGQEIGQLKPGTFSNRCGWTSQAANWFHLHWGFPDTGTFEAGGWTLDLSDELWRRGSETRGIRSWFEAEEDAPQPPPPPILVSPTHGVTLPYTSAITLTWNVSSGATAYNAHLGDGSSLDVESGWSEGTRWHVGQLMPGAYAWRVRARNDEGESDWSASWSFTVLERDTVPPTGQITAPADGAAITACPLLIQAEAEDEKSGVHHVEFHAFFDDAWLTLGDDSTEPYDWSWDCSSIGDQDIVLRMAIWDNAGNQAMDPEGNVHITLDRSGGEDCPASGGAILYKEADFGCAGEGQGSGYLIRTLPGWQNLPSVLDDQASSLRVPPGWSVRLYEDVDRGGASVCRDADDADLSRGTYPGGGELDDTVSSWSVFDDDACGTDEGARWMYLPLAILDHR